MFLSQKAFIVIFDVKIEGSEKKHKKLETLTKKVIKKRLNDRTSESWKNLRELKKLKLRLKDRINHLKH